MTSSHRAAINLKDAELRVFWQLSDLHARLMESDPTDPMLDDLRDEFDVMAQMTDWPQMREACLRAIRHSDAARKLKKVGVA